MKAHVPKIKLLYYYKMYTVTEIIIYPGTKACSTIYRRRHIQMAESISYFTL